MDFIAGDDGNYRDRRVRGDRGIRGIRGEMAKNKMWIGVLMMVGIHAIFNNTMFYPPVLGLLALIRAASED